LADGSGYGSAHVLANIAPTTARRRLPAIPLFTRAKLECVDAAKSELCHQTHIVRPASFRYEERQPGNQP